MIEQKENKIGQDCRTLDKSLINNTFYFGIIPNYLLTNRYLPDSIAI